MRRRSGAWQLLRYITLALVAGTALGIVELWQFEPSWPRFLAAIAAGVVFTCSMSLVLTVFRSSAMAMQLALLAVAGALGGIAWWLVGGARSSNWATAAAVGLVFAWVFYFASGGRQQDESQAA
jgi:hypothetical protein